MEHVLSEINKNILNKDFVITTGVGKSSNANISIYIK